MTTILETYAQGRGNRRCDAVCHRAKGSVCRCICGGAFHGLGDEAAAAITAEQLDEVRRKIDLYPHESVQLRIGA